MTNEMLLREVIKKKGYKLSFVANSIGLSYQGFLNKITGKSEFTASEIQGLCDLLSISKELRDKIFFAKRLTKNHLKQAVS